MTINEDYRFAIQEYGKALGGMQKLIPIRMTLLAALLTFSFENFHGNHLSAFAQIQSAANLLQEWMKAREKRQITDRNISPAPDVIEDLVFAAFHSTHLGLISAIDPTISQAQDIFYKTQMYIPSPIPVEFKDIDDASYNFTSICRQVISFLMRTANLIRGDQQPMEDNTVDSAIWSKRMLDCSPVMIEFREILDKIDHWQTAFEPLAKRTRKEDSNFIAIAITRAHWLTTRSSLHSAFFPHAPAHVNQPYFEEIVEICKTVAAHPNFEKGFVFYAGVIPSLTAAARFGARSIRIEAIKVLEDIRPRREGNWDAAISARNAIAAMNMEDKELRRANREEGTVVEEL